LVTSREPPRPAHTPYPPLFRSSIRGTTDSSRISSTGFGSSRPREENGSAKCFSSWGDGRERDTSRLCVCPMSCGTSWPRATHRRSEEHTSELQSRENLVCRLLL